MNIPREAVSALAHKLRNGDWNLRAPQELADMIASELDALSEHGGGGEAVADDGEKWGQQFRCGCFLGYPTKRAIPHFCPQHSRGRQGSALPLSSTFTTPPTPSAPAPAADPLATAGDDLAEQYRKGWEAGRADALGQPEARGVEGMDEVIETLKAAREEQFVISCSALLAGEKHGKGDKAALYHKACSVGNYIDYALDLLAATPNPVRAEQPEGKGEDALIALFNEVYEREWDRAADEADDRAKAIMGPADEHATRMAIRAVLAAAPAAPVGGKLLRDLRMIAEQGEMPDGDGVPVNVRLWAEKHVAALTPAAAPRGEESAPVVQMNNAPQIVPAALAGKGGA